MFNQTLSSSNASPPLEITCSRHLPAWLYEQQLSLAFTTYQTNRLFLLGLKATGELSASERLFDRPMGLAATSERLYMSSRYQVWQFDNALPPGVLSQGYDRLYIPRLGYTTGELDIHDIALDKAGRVIFVNTVYSCLAMLSDRYSFTPLWQPPFISRLVPEECCHLNGLAMVEGEPGYVSAISRSDVANGWRERRHDGGCIVDVQRNEVVLSGLSMPHSPRFYRGKLWVLNSGAGEFGYVDLERGRFEPVAFCPGYLRGLAFQGNLAIVGLSKPRDRAFTGLALAERLAAKDAEARCGLRFIDLNSGHIVHGLDLEGVVTELYDVQVLPGVRRPMALGFRTEEIGQVVTIEQPPSFLLHHLVSTEALSSDLSTGPAASPSQTVAATPPYQFQLHPEISLDVALVAYGPFTFPSLREKAQSKSLQEPLLAVTATQQERLVGVALAEIGADRSSAELLSLFVEPIHRRKGVGSGLLARLEEALDQQGCSYIDVLYRTHWASLEAIEQLLKKQGWTPPQIRMLLCKADPSQIAKAPWFHQYALPGGFSLFPWNELTLQERQAIQQQQAANPWYPPELTPFQEEEKIENLNSLGLRYQGQVVGWMITHRLRHDLIQYTSLFVRQELQRLGRAIPLAIEAIRRHAASPVPHGIFMIDVQNRPMVNFLERRLQPYLLSRAESRAARRWLR